MLNVTTCALVLNNARILTSQIREFDLLWYKFDYLVTCVYLKFYSAVRLIGLCKHDTFIVVIRWPSLQLDIRFNW